MFDLICALAIGILIGFLLKQEKRPPLVDVLQKQVEYLEEQVSYYKGLCKWHAERKYRPEKDEE